MGDEKTTLKKYNDHSSKNGHYLVGVLGSDSFRQVKKS